MLPRKNRLTKRADFNNVYKKGTYFSEGPISLKTTSNNSDITRIGFSIEKKFFKKAVERNRIKRILRETFHKHLEDLKKGLDIVVFYKRSESKPDSEIIHEIVKKIIKKIK